MRSQLSKTYRPSLETLEDRNLMSVGAEFHVNTTTFLDQNEVAVASQPVANGRSVVVWTSQYRSDYSDGDIKAQIYDGAGRKVGGEITVAGSIYNERDASVAMDAYGRFVVTWTEDVTGPGGDTMIRAQRFFANGAKNGSVMLIANDSRREYFSDVAMDQNGNFVVAYTQQTTPSNMDVLARRYDSNGTFLGGMVVGGTSAHELFPSVARAPDGRFSIGYQVSTIQSNGTLNADIRLNRYSAAGGLLGVHTIANSAKNEIAPDVAMDRAGNTVIVYELFYSGTDHDILARKVFSNGIMGSTMSVDSSSSYEWAPTVAMDLSDGDFVVAYNRGVSGPSSVIVREMTSTGGIKSTTNLGAVGYTPAISINDSDVYFLAYTSNQRADDNGQGIRGRRGFLA